MDQQVFDDLLNTFLHAIKTIDRRGMDPESFDITVYQVVSQLLGDAEGHLVMNGFTEDHIELIRCSNADAGMRSAIYRHEEVCEIDNCEKSEWLNEARKKYATAVALIDREVSIIGDA
jgi:hypothetical protein